MRNQTSRLKMLAPRLMAGKQRQVKTGVERITGHKWMQIRKLFALSNPQICAECDRQGNVGNGNELDHIVPLWAGGSNDFSNLQWLCYEHHRQKSSKETKMRESGDFNFDNKTSSHSRNEWGG